MPNEDSHSGQDPAREHSSGSPSTGSDPNIRSNRGRRRRRRGGASARGHANARTSNRPKGGLGRGLQLSAIAIPFLTVISAAAFCYFARPILVPLVTAVTLAYVLSPGVNFLVRKKIPRVLGVVIVLGIAMAILGLIGFVVIDQAQGLARDLPGYWSNLQEMSGSIQEWMTRLPPQMQTLLPPPETDIWSQLAKVDFPEVSRTVFAGLGSVLSFLIWGLLVGFLTLFVLLDMPHMYERVVLAMGRESEEEVRATLSNINQQLRGFLSVKLATSAGLGIVATIGLLLLDVPYAYVWGPLVGFLNIIPYIGGVISAIPPIITVVLHTKSIMPGVWVFLLILVLQQIEGNIVTPKLIGNKVKLNVVAVLISTVLWGWLWGAIGILLAIPITAAVKVVCERIEPLRPIATLLD